MAYASGNRPHRKNARLYTKEAGVFLLHGFSSTFIILSDALRFNVYAPLKAILVP